MIIVWFRLVAIEMRSDRFCIYFEDTYCEGFVDEFSIRDGTSRLSRQSRYFGWITE